MSNIEPVRKQTYPTGDVFVDEAYVALMSAWRPRARDARNANLAPPHEPTLEDAAQAYNAARAKGQARPEDIVAAFTAAQSNGHDDSPSALKPPGNGPVDLKGLTPVTVATLHNLKAHARGLATDGQVPPGVTGALLRIEDFMRGVTGAVERRAPAQRAADVQVELKTPDGAADEITSRVAVDDSAVAAEAPHVSPENEQYLDRSVDLETLSIPVAVFPGTKLVIPQSEAAHVGWSTFIDAIAPTPAPVIPLKKDVPYVITGKLKAAKLSDAAQVELRRAGKGVVDEGKQRAMRCLASFGPALLLDDDVVDGDVFDRVAKLKALGIAAVIYSSHSYGFGKMGGRVMLFLNRPYRIDEHPTLWDGINHWLGGGFDTAGRTAAQCYGMHARRSNDAPHKRVVVDGAALNVDALIALGRSLMPEKKASTPAEPVSLSNQSASLEEPRSAVAFLLDCPEELQKLIADEPKWMNIARSFAHQARYHPEHREELERLFDALSKKAPGYDKAKNADRFDRYVNEADMRPAGGAEGDARTMRSFYALVRGLGWKGYVPPGVALDEPGHEVANRQLIQQQVAADPEMFNRSNILVRLRVPKTNELMEGIEWKGDMPGTAIAQTPDIMLCAERIEWNKHGKKGLYRTPVPRPFVGDYITQVKGEGAKPLRGLTRLPIINDDGNIRCFSGYDRETGLFNDRPIHLDIPAKVSHEQACHLATKLFHPYSLYTLKDPERGRAAILSAIFTALELSHLPVAPMYVLSAAMAGNGKGKLAGALAALSIDSTPAMMTWGGSNDEFEKRLSALLMQTPNLVIIDNANGVMIKSAILESIITSGFGDLRILGFSKMPRVYLRALLLLTGNNPIITGDMARRALLIALEARSASPEQERFAFDPIKYTRQHRKGLLEAAFSIMRAFRQAGMPEYPDLPAVGSFDEWERKVRNLVYWLTGCNVSEGFQLNKAEDPHRQNDGSLLEALYHRFFDEERAPYSQPFRGAEVIAAYERGKSAYNKIEADVALYEALNEVMDTKKVTAKSFGWWARRVNGAHYGDFVLEARHDHDANALKIKCTNPEKVKQLTLVRAAERAELEKKAAEHANSEPMRFAKEVDTPVAAIKKEK